MPIKLLDIDHTMSYQRKAGGFARLVVTKVGASIKEKSVHRL
ncbi:MAG: hypothetical protein WBQ25_04285 [Nitrososphaeraceae archaeon]